MRAYSRLPPWVGTWKWNSPSCGDPGSHHVDDFARLGTGGIFLLVAISRDVVEFNVVVVASELISGAREI